MTTSPQRPELPPTRVAERLAAFVAWLATRVEHEETRSACREVAEAYLLFAERDHGTPESRRSRFLQAYHGVAPGTVHAGLNLLAEHEAVVRKTLPIDG
ncbi:hypothetical protein SAMN05216207_10899 [Pseudonocardia ammonioxydans]|uniref:Uncharacterized protein n=1 Tax=Pseudonocardia ammonioxydans TaxID=260086 RepID=A0A1I5I6U4_PSUAM|nr:hypothetical protein [Pseudonocardia ammonioxydans]SFO56247.1 hypothetical protein SAMN05216207_10899 [Pseudonocardia ammonioxydans]